MEGKGMEYVYAAMLLHKAGKPINEESLIQVLGAAGVNADPIKVKALVASLAEVDIEEALKSTSAFMPAPSGPATAPKPEGKREEETEEEKKEEEKEKEEAALEGLGALFG